MPGLQFFDTKECEYNDLEISIAGVPVTKARGITYSIEDEQEALYAAGGKPISIQNGNRKYAGELRLLKGALDDLDLAARLAGGECFLDIEVDILSKYKKQGERAMKADILVRCKFSKIEKKFSQGDKFMEVAIPFMFLGIKSA